jgi:hypothetical protein
MQRQQEITAWLEGIYPGRSFTLAPASADASFRRYLRVSFADGETLVVMDAPPSHEDCKPWLHVQQLFADAGAHVPAVLATDLERGYPISAARPICRPSHRRRRRASTAMPWTP